MITLIAAVGENNELGRDNQLVWHLPDDFKRFKSITTGYHIIMGRKTFESFPKPLPNRTHVIITRKKDYNPEGCIVVNSIQDAISKCPQDEDVYVIGGGEIYKQSIEFADKLEITRVHHSFEADTYFPKINSDQWNIIFEEFHPKDEKHNYDFTYFTYIRNTN
jgi:dihydrofolate reductase